jgi:hypothetical protein
VIWHLAGLSRWRSAREREHVASPAGGEAFVHASPDIPVSLAVANAMFAGLAEPLVALGLDEGRLSAEVRHEPPDPAPPPGAAAGTLFPHVYGPVETAAVVEVRYARRDLGGRYAAFEERPATAEALDLTPHLEGGWYRQTWAAGPAFEPPGYAGSRAPATAIYFLLRPGERSCWHTVRSDELWLWHAGGPLTLYLGGSGARPGEPSELTLGPDLAAGQRPQHLVPGGCWQAARPAGAQEVLVSCVVAPGYDSADFSGLPEAPG